MNSVRTIVKLFCTLTFLVFLLSPLSAADGSGNSKYPKALRLPTVPKNCVLAAYGPILFPADMIQAIEKDGGWKRHLEKLEVKFPDGGFAVYFSATDTLFVATTEEEQQLAEVLFTAVAD